MFFQNLFVKTSEITENFEDYSHYYNNSYNPISEFLDTSLLKNNYKNSNFNQIWEIINTNKEENSSLKIASILIQFHFLNKQCILYKIVKAYIYYFCDYYQSISQCNEFLNVSIWDDVVRDLQQFIEVLGLMMKGFYNLSNGEISDDSIEIIATNIMLGNYQIYNILLDYASKINKKQENQLKFVYQKFQNYNPEQFDIPKELCLNDTTIQNHINQKLTNYKEALQHYHNRSTPVSNSAQYLYNEYFQAQEKLKQFCQTPSAIQKILMLYEVATTVAGCISAFYEKTFQITYDTSSATSDDIMSLFIYVIIKSQISNLFSQLQIIESFLPNRINKSILGYYFITFQAGVQFIMEMDQQNEIQNRNSEIFQRHSFCEAIHSISLHSNHRCQLPNTVQHNYDTNREIKQMLII